MTTLPWIEKYRPANVDKIISHDNIVLTLKKYLDKKTLPNLILFGSPGIGKTSLIKACANELYGENIKLMTLEINASEERGIDVVRTRITQFANSRSTFTWGNSESSIVKLIILDEADSMTADAQVALKNTIDTYSHTTRFCLICNCIKKIHYSLISRCIRFRLHPLQKNQIFDHVKTICTIENIDITDNAIYEIIKYSHGDMRRVVNVLQSVQTAYKNIDRECINKYLNQISNNNIIFVFETLFNDKIKIAYDKIYSLIYENGFSLYELIVRINDTLIAYMIHNKTTNSHEFMVSISAILDKVNINNLLDIIIKLGKIEYQIFSNVNTPVLIASLIGSCKLD